MKYYPKTWPCLVKCYGRTYAVHTPHDFDQLIEWLVTRKLALANRYRVSENPSSRYFEAHR